MLTSERVAEIREHLRIGWRDHDEDAYEPAVVLEYIDRESGEKESACIANALELKALLDAYEAQRPRPASEVPRDASPVLCEADGEYYRGWYVAEIDWWCRVGADGRPEQTDAPEHWWPLPEVPE